MYTALDEKYIAASQFDQAYALAEETTKIIGGLMGYLRRSSRAGSRFKRSPA